MTSCPRQAAHRGPGLDPSLDSPPSRLRPGPGPAVAEPLAHLAYAVRYQEFLDGIEPSERIYHQGDPAASIRAALKAR